MKDLQGENEVQLEPTIQVKHLPLLLRPKQTCELFGIDLKALHKLETSGRVKAVRIGPKKVQRRGSALPLPNRAADGGCGVSPEDTSPENTG